MRNKILNIEFILFVGIGSRLSFNAKFEHLPESSEDKVLTCFEFAHSNCFLNFTFLLYNVKNRTLSILLHGALCGLFKESINRLISGIFVI